MQITYVDVAMLAKGKKASAKLVCAGTRVMERGRMLRPNCKVWDLSPTFEVWNCNGDLYGPWALQPRELAFGE